MYSKYRARVFAWLVKQSKCRCVLFVKAFLCKREGVLIKVKEDTLWVYVYFVKSIKVKNILLQLFLHVVKKQYLYMIFEESEKIV